MPAQERDATVVVFDIDERKTDEALPEPSDDVSHCVSHVGPQSCWCSGKMTLYCLVTPLYRWLAW